MKKTMSLSRRGWPYRWCLLSCGSVLLSGSLPAQETGLPPATPPPLSPGGFGIEYGDHILPEGEEFDPLGYNPRLRLVPEEAAEVVAGPETPLLKLAQKIVDSVVLLRAYDAYGLEIARTAGFYISTNGRVMTDASLLHGGGKTGPAYITMVSAQDQAHFIAGALHLDRHAGVLVLQSDVKDSVPLELATDLPRKNALPVGIVAVKEEKGLLLADGVCSLDETVPNNPWLKVEGQDSPGVVGSPVLDLEGRVLGMIGMQLKLKQWVNFAVPLDRVMKNLATTPPALLPVDQLARTHPRAAEDDERLAEGWRLLYEGSYRRASSVLLHLAREYPRSASVWALLGFASKQQGENEQALNAFRRAAALDAAQGIAWYGLALAEATDPAVTSQAGIESIGQALENTIKSQPEYLNAWRMLARYRSRSGDYDKAADAARQAISLSGGRDAESFYFLAFSLGKKNDFEGARTAILRSVSLNPKNAEASFYLGLVEARLGHTGEAIAAYKRCTDLDADHPRAWMNLAHAYLKEGRQAEARVAAREHARLGGAISASKRPVSKN